jgi:hypothetical protein
MASAAQVRTLSTSRDKFFLLGLVSVSAFEFARFFSRTDALVFDKQDVTAKSSFDSILFVTLI